ncbi:MAG: hypothetical protein GKR98_06495 [Boseongicola sp.]|nr:MAG: hypothetical protein GKR98_06495 [Boseongicola sp.]
MAIEWTTAAWFFPFILPIAIWVSWSDMAFMKIPNKAVLATLAIFAVVGLVALPFTEYLWRYAHFAVVLAITFVLNALRLIGAGDAKFAAAMAPFIALADWFTFMFLLAGMIIAAFIVHRAVRASPLRERFPDWESWTRKEFPMGFALAPALAVYLLIPLVSG